MTNGPSEFGGTTD